MRNFCTLFNQNYQYHAATLYDSLCTNHSDFRLYALCMDEASLQYVNSLQKSNFIGIDIKTVELFYPELLPAKQNRSLIEYFFTCTPVICQYLLQTQDAINELVYLDADLYFFDTPEIVFDEIKDASISIIPHRFEGLNKRRNVYGFYNVGWVSFKKDVDGLACLHDWFLKCINWCYDKLEDGKYADQKYLNDWSREFNKVHVIENIGANAAPWNIGNYNVTLRNKKIYLDDQALVFYHYASLKWIEGSFYTTCSSYFAKLKSVIKNEIYLTYINKLLKSGFVPKTGLRQKNDLLHTLIRKLIRFVYKDNIKINSFVFQKPKILVIHTHYLQAGGEDTVVEQELALLKQHYIVESLFFQNPKEFKGALQFFFSICNLRAANKVKQKIKEFKPDLVHLHNWHFASGPWVIRTIKKMDVTLVATLHNYRLLCPSAILLHNNQLFLDSLQQNFPWNAIRKKVYRNSLWQTFWLASVVWFHKKIGTWKMINTYVCLTSFTIELFKRSNFDIPSTNFFVKPNFTNLPDSVQNSKRENHFLFIGRLSEEKGIKMLLEAFKELPYTLNIVGDGPLKDLVRKATITNKNIIYKGSLAKEGVIHELQQTQALVFPSICYETFGLVIIEAFSTSTPVLASNLGSMSTMIQHHTNGLHFTAGDVASLKETLHEFCALSEEKKEQLRVNAFASYQTLYSPKTQMPYFEAIYKKAVGSKTVPTPVL